MLKPWKCKVSQIIRCLIKPLLKNSTQTIFQLGTPWVTEILNNVIVSMVLYCAQKLLGWKKHKPFIHLSLGKAGPFTLESHIRCLIKPLLKNSTHTIFQGGTPWLAQILNIIVWMAPYCAQKCLGWKTIKTHQLIIVNYLIIYNLLAVPALATSLSG